MLGRRAVRGFHTKIPHGETKRMHAGDVCEQPLVLTKSFLPVAGGVGPADRLGGEMEKRILGVEADVWGIVRVQHTHTYYIINIQREINFLKVVVFERGKNRTV